MVREWVLAAWMILGTGAAVDRRGVVERAPEGDAPRVLLLSDQSARFLALQFRSFGTEFMGCMIGEIRDSTVLVERIAPADVDPSQSTPSWVVPLQTCEAAGWTGTVGTIHSHPMGERCWYFFPGTRVVSSDGRSFLLSRYAVDAIMCGDRVVWIGRNLVERQTAVSGGHERRRAVTLTP